MNSYKISFIFDKVINIRLMKEAILHGICGWENNQTNKFDLKKQKEKKTWLSNIIVDKVGALFLGHRGLVCSKFFTA